MLSWLKQLAVWALPLIVIGVLVFGALSLRVPVPTEKYQQCLNDHQKDGNKNTECKTDETIWNRTLNDPIAYYTLWLTIFTYALAVVGIAQWHLIAKQIKLANDEFAATHRPKLFVHTLTVTDKGKRRSRYAATLPENEQASAAAQPAKGVITVANGGDSVAFIIEWQSIVYYQASDAAFTPHLDIADVQRPKPDAPGISPGVFMPIGHSQVHAIDQEWQSFVEGVGDRMFFIGRITYEGPDKIRRSIGFCREWDKTKEGRWKPTNYSEYEYSY